MGEGDEGPRPVTTAKHALATLDGEKVSIGQVVSTAGGKAVVAIDGGGTAELSSLTFKNPEIAKVYEAAATYGTNAARALVEGYDGSIPADKYVKAANHYINVGERNSTRHLQYWAYQPHLQPMPIRNAAPKIGCTPTNSRRILLV